VNLGMTQIAIVGSAGRMGQTLVRLAEDDPALELVAVLDQGDPMTALAAFPGAVAIDFSSPAGTRALAESAPSRGLNLCAHHRLDDAATRASRRPAARCRVRRCAT